MVDRKVISSRFFSCFADKSRRNMATLFKVTKGSVTGWANKGTVPWSKLKYLSDSQAISWDWLIEGKEPKHSDKAIKIPKTPSPQFNTKAIAKRFLSLYPNMTQTEIAAILGVTVTTVNDWKRNKCKVGWDRLADAVGTFGIRWDWLIDGVEPKYRELLSQESIQ